MAQVETHLSFSSSSQQFYSNCPSIRPPPRDRWPPNSLHSHGRSSLPETGQHGSTEQYCCNEDCDPSRPHSTSQQPHGSIENNDQNPAILFPAYDRAVSIDHASLDPVEDNEGEKDHEEYREGSLCSPSSSGFTTPTFKIADDIGLEQRHHPTCHVDYLSHDWLEPDLWSSWRYIRKESRGFPEDAARLENASWRSWAKAKYRLKRIHPKSLNWFAAFTWLALIVQVETLR